MSELTVEDRRTALDRLHADRDVHDVPLMYSELIGQGVDPVQICRTCTKTEPQRIKVSLKEMASLKKENDGILPDSAFCQPAESIELRTVRSDRTITPLRSDGKVPVELQTKAQRAESVATVDTCGQNIQDKCRGCSRFKRINVRVKGGMNANGRPYFVEVVIGGHCTIPAEGIIINGEVTMCDKQPYSKDPLGLSRSCSNCKWRSSYSEPHMLDHVSPLRWGLTSYEREVAIEGVDPDQIGVVLNETSRNRGKVKVKASPHTDDKVMSWAGMTKFFKLSIVRVYEDDAQRPVSVDVRIPTTGDIFNFNLAEGDDSIGMISIVDTQTAILEITSPHHRKYGLPDRNRISYPQAEVLVDCDKCGGNRQYSTFDGIEFKEVPCQQCGGTGQIGGAVPPNVFIVEDNSDLVDDYCTQCHGNTPCYHHLRQPMLRESRSVVRLLNGVIETEHTTVHSYRRSESRQVIQIEPDEKRLVLKREDGRVWVEDATGKVPSFALFRIRIRSIMDWCKNKEERKQVLRQFADAKNKVIHGPDRLVDYSWSMPAPVAAFHAFCSMNLYDQEHGHPTVKTFNDHGDSAGLVSTARGIDFAHEWNDEFGTPRDQISTNRIMESFGQREIRLDPKFSWAKAQENEEWMRVHSTGEIIQDEFIASLHQLMRGRKSENGTDFPGMPEDSVVVDLGVGIPNTSIILTSTQDAIDWLSQEIEMPGNDEAKGFKTTRRWAALGYENFRNTKRLQEGDINSVFEFSKRDAMSDKEDDEARVGFYACTRCYDPTDEGGAGRYYPHEVSTIDLTCPNPECDGMLFFMPSEEHRQGHMRATNDQIEPDEPYRRRSGSADSLSWQQSERLQSMSCPHWQPRRGW